MKRLKRHQITTIPNGKLHVHIEADADKMYARIHAGMVGETAIEVGYSSVNGSLGALGPKAFELCKDAVIQEANLLIGTLSGRNEHEWLNMLYNVVNRLDAVYNNWICNHQQMLIENNSPRYKGQNNATFLGKYNEFDLYNGEQHPLPDTLIARYGDRDCDYTSFNTHLCTNADMNLYPHFVEAYRLAKCLLGEN